MKRFQEFLNEKLTLENAYGTDMQQQVAQQQVAPAQDNTQWADPQNPQAGGSTSKTHFTQVPGLFITQTQQGFLPVNGKNEPVERGWQHSRHWYPSFEEAFKAGRTAIRGW